MNCRKSLVVADFAVEICVSDSELLKSLTYASPNQNPPPDPSSPDTCPGSASVESLPPPRRKITPTWKKGAPRRRRDQSTQSSHRFGVPKRDAVSRNANGLR